MDSRIEFPNVTAPNPQDKGRAERAAEQRKREDERHEQMLQRREIAQMRKQR